MNDIGPFPHRVVFTNSETNEVFEVEILAKWSSGAIHSAQQRLKLPVGQYTGIVEQNAYGHSKELFKAVVVSKTVIGALELAED